jgi:hypothetical protein
MNLVRFDTPPSSVVENLESFQPVICSCVRLAGRLAAADAAGRVSRIVLSRVAGLPARSSLPRLAALGPRGMEDRCGMAVRREAAIAICVCSSGCCLGVYLCGS